MMYFSYVRFLTIFDSLNKSIGYAVVYKSQRLISNQYIMYYQAQKCADKEFTFEREI